MTANPPLREKIAARLLTRDSFNALDMISDHAEECEGRSESCSRCASDSALADADRIIAECRKVTPGMVERADAAIRIGSFGGQRVNAKAVLEAALRSG